MTLVVAVTQAVETLLEIAESGVEEGVGQSRAASRQSHR